MAGAGTVDRIARQLLSIEPGHYTHFLMEKYSFRSIVKAIERLTESRQGYFTCKRIDIAHLYIVRRDG